MIKDNLYYKLKYLKYKSKYINYKNLIGGTDRVNIPTRPLPLMPSEQQQQQQQVEKIFMKMYSGTLYTDLTLKNLGLIQLPLLRGNDEQKKKQ